MNKNYTSIIVLITILFFGMLSAQETQKNFINYQGVARNASNELMVEENMNITISVKFGAANASTVYEENHSINTDTNGVFSLLIGNGSAVTGNYNTLPWGSAATFVTVSINGQEVGTTEMMAVPYAISAGSMKDPLAGEVLYDNSASGLTATTAQDAIDELVSGGSVDADTDPTNELQTISFDPGSNELSLTDGGVVTIPSGGTDADADPTNEIQTISFDPASNKISLTDGGEITIPSGGTDADADPSNELQTLSFDVGTNELSLSDGNTVTIPSGGTDADADPENEIDVTRRHGLLVGDDGIVDGLIGTADGQVAKWDAALGNWVAGADETGGAGGGSLWSENGSDIFYSSGVVGIGTAPRFPLDVKGNVETTLNLETSDNNNFIRFVNSDGYQGYAGILNGNQDMDFGTGTGNETGKVHLVINSTPKLTVAEDGNVGIGTMLPTAKLDVDGKIKSSVLSGAGQRNVMADTDGNLVIGSSVGGSSLWTENGGHIHYETGRVGIGTGVNVPATRFEIAGIPGVSEELGFDNALFTITDNELTGGPFRLIMGGSTIQTTAAGALSSLRLNPEGGNVGIGTSPSTTLDVDGDARIRNLGGIGNRNVMADADGNLVIGSSGGGSSLWAENEDGVYRNDGNVAIGDDPHTQRRLYVSSTDETIRNGFYSRIAHSGYKVAISARAEGNDANNTFGMRSDARGESTGTAWAYRGDIGGAGTGRKFGLDLIFYDGTAGEKYGIYSKGEDKNYFSGALGLGTEDPTAKMHVLHDSGIASPQLRLEESAADYSRLEFKNASTGFWHIAGRGGATGDVSRLNFYHHDGTSGRDYMTIAGSGNIGIGTSSPTEKLHVKGDFNLSGKMKRETTGTADMLPIAYGRIAMNGSVEEGSGNFTVNKIGSNYFIRVAGQTLTDATQFSMVATRLGSGGPGFITTGYGRSGGVGSMIANTYDIDGNDADAAFSFVIYKD